MILNLNNSIGYLPKSLYEYDGNKDFIFASDKYPAQNNNFVNKLVRVKFMDESSRIVHNRLCINKNMYPEFTGANTFDNILFRILRYDNEYPFKVILVDQRSRVIVTTKERMEDLVYYPGYIYSEDEVSLKTEDWDYFNGDGYANEFVNTYPIQDENFLGTVVHTEYPHDIYTKNDKPYDRSNQFKQKDELVEEVLQGIEIKGNVLPPPNEILLSFPHYHDRHKFDLLDYPRHCINTGIIVRCDIPTTAEAHVVVIDWDKDNNRRVILDDEANFYYDNTESKENIGALNLWQKL